MPVQDLVYPKIQQQKEEAPKRIKKLVFSHVFCWDRNMTGSGQRLRRYVIIYGSPKVVPKQVPKVLLFLGGRLLLLLDLRVQCRVPR